MKEKFLHFVWNFQLFQQQNLCDTKGQPFHIIHKGHWNAKDSGPDFLEAQIQTDSTTWAGNIEIHVKSSDWDLHKHSSDNSYSNIILHVVFEHDKEIEFLRERKIPTLELKNYIPKEVIFNYKQLLESNRSFIPCENSISQVSDEAIKFWLERIFIQRLERRVNEIQEEFLRCGKDWEKLLFKKLAYTFGLKINSEGFTQWSNSFDFKILQKIRNRKEKVYALFLGQAGFLEIETGGKYLGSLKNEYRFLSVKYNLQPMNSSVFKFFRLRPAGFPTIRLAQLAEIYARYPNLFIFLTGTKSSEKIYPIFDEIELPEFWKNHFRLDKKSHYQSQKKMSKELIERIIINVIVPIKFAYAQSIGKDINEELIAMMTSISPENNTIIQGFSELGFKAENAFESQAYIELKKHYCDVKNCLNCSIGLQILKNVRTTS